MVKMTPEEREFHKETHKAVIDFVEAFVKKEIRPIGNRLDALEDRNRTTECNQCGKLIPLHYVGIVTIRAGGKEDVVGNCCSSECCDEFLSKHQTEEKQYSTLAEADDKELFKERFRQEWAKGKAYIYRPDGWMNCRKTHSLVSFRDPPEYYRLPLPLPELKPLPCAINGHEWGEPTIARADGSYWVDCFDAKDDEGAIISGESGNSEQDGVMRWNQLQRANGAEYPTE